MVDTVSQTKHWMDSREWLALTMGEFVSLMVDGGRDAVLARVTENEPSENGQWIMHLELMLVPEDRVVATIEREGCELIHKTLAAQIERGVVR